MSNLKFTAEQEEAIHNEGWLKQLACTYIGDYHVTTCYRQSSGLYDLGWYYETFVWANATQESKRELVHQSDDGHFATCQKIIEQGDFWNRENYDE